MLFDSIKFVEGSEVQNLVVNSGTSLPANPVRGELFYRTDALNEGLYVYNGTDWKRHINAGDDAEIFLPDIVATGSFKTVTVDAKGRVTGGSNPTTLSGFGIVDAQPLDAQLTAISGLSTNGLIVKTGAGTADTRSIAVSGTGLSVSNADGVSGNPTITSNATDSNIGGTIVARDSSGNFSANSITAAFLSGNGSSITNLNAANIATGTLSVTRGGTGATTLTGYVRGNGVSAFTAISSIPGSDISGNISGNAANVTGIVAVANGGTGATSGEAACNNLGAPRINPATAKDGDIQVDGSDIFIYADGEWRQIFPPVYHGW